MKKFYSPLEHIFFLLFGKTFLKPSKIRVIKSSPERFKRFFYSVTAIFFLFTSGSLFSQVIGTETITTVGTSTWTCPTGVTTVTVQCWGGGGAGGGATGNPAAGGGGSGGAYATSTVSVTGGTNYSVTVGSGGTASTTTVVNGSPSWFSSASTVYAPGGNGGGLATANSATASGATAVTTGGIGTTIFYGGAGGTGGASGASGGGGGGSGGTGSAGNAASGVTGGAAVTGGGGGANGSTTGGAGAAGTAPGGGGAGGHATSNTDRAGGAGGQGQVIISYVQPSPTVEAFTSQVFCATSYTTPPAYYNTVNFSLVETSVTNFDASQTNATIILTLPAGFQFNTGVAPTISANTANGVTQDISGLSSSFTSNTVLQITVTTDGTPNCLDEINVTGLQIGATTSGSSGDLVRTGGTFKINTSTSVPSSTTSFGHLSTSGLTTINATAVNQYTTSTVTKGCTTNPYPILEFKLTLNGGSCTPNDALTQLIFSTTGSTNAATDITKASVYFADTTQGFSNANYFGSVTSPNGTFTVTGSQSLNKGNGPYYFYLAYTVPATATTGDVLDGTMSSFIFNGTTYTVSGNPAGNQTIATGTCVTTPDIAPVTANTQTVTAGSLIIPMDNTHQVSGGFFNLKAYGLVHALLNNDIPVKWIIKSGKAKDAADFSASVSSYKPTTSTVVTVESFTASAFAIDSYYVDHAYYSGGQNAAQVISSYTSSVQVYKVTANVAVDVRYTLNHRPKIAVFSNGGYESIQTTMLDNAGITNYYVQDAGDFAGLAECYTFCSESHWDYSSNPDTRPVQRVVDFVNEGGNFLAQCAGIDLYENRQPLGGHFMSTGGITWSGTSGLGTNTDYNADMALSQYQTGVSSVIGRIPFFYPATSSVYKPEAYVTTGGTTTNTVVASAIHLGNPDSTGYNVFYLAGHQYTSASNNEINGQRIYLNATLIPAGRPTAFPLVVTTPVTICAGQTVSIGPGTCNSNATYQWGPSTGLNSASVCNPVASPTTTTTYSVVGFNGGCIMGPTSMTVNVNPTPVMTSTNSASICGNGTVNIPLTSNMASTYQWIAADNPNTTGESITTQTTATLSNTIVNNTTSIQTIIYTVTPTSTTGTCTGTPQTVTVTVSPAPSMTSANTATVCSGSPVSISLTSNIAGATFTWIAADNPNTTGESLTSQSTATLSNTITNNTTSAQAVVYTVTPTAGGCLGNAQTVTVTVYPMPTVTATPSSQSLCSGATTTVTLTGSVAGTTYSWTVGQTNVSGATASSGTLIAQTLSATGVSAGQAIYTITPTANTCPGTPITEIVTVNPIPSVTATPTSQTICSGGATSVALTSNVAGTTFAWTVTQTNVSGASASSGSSITQTLTATSTSAGTAVYTITPTANSCSGSNITATVTVNPTPSATATPASSAICSNNATSVNLGSNVAGTTYSWTVTQTNVSGAASGSGSSITQTLTATSTSAGTAVYTITPTVGSCPGTAVTATVTVNPAPSATATPGSSTICSGNATAINLTSNVAGTTYSWTVTQTNVSGAASGSGSSITQTLTATGTSAGTAVYTITPTAGSCAGSAITATVTVNPAPSATATPSSSTICSNNATSINLSSNVAGTTYSWTVTQTNVSGASGSSGSSITQTLTATGTSAGTAVYTITPTVGSCPGTAVTATVTVNPAPSATATPSSSTICSNNATSIALSSNVAGTTYSWTVTQTNVSGASSGSGSSIAQTLTATGTSAGTAVYTITPTASSCAGSAITATVTVNPAPSATATPAAATICSGNATAISLTSNVAGTTFAWTVTQTNVSGASGSTGSSITQTLTATGTTAGTAVYTITPTASSCAGSAITATVTVNPTPSATATPNSQSICSNNATSIALSSNVAGTTYSWTVTQTNVTGASSASGSTIAQTLTATTSSAGTAVYTITPTASSCPGSAITTTVTVNPAPTVTATPSSQQFCSGSATSIALSSSTGGTTYAWTVTQSGVSGASAASGSNITQTLTATGNSPGTATYTITPTAASCSGTPIVVTVTVNPIPSATATPNSQSICSNNATSIALTSSATGTTFAWTVTQSNVTGATAATGTTIAQTLTATTTNPGTATYTITPSVGTCNGSAITATVTVNPAPSVTATPTSSSICSGSASSIALTSSTAGATFAWTVTQTNVSGASAGSGTVIAQTLTATGTTAGTAVYTITPSSGGCAGTPVTATVTVKPIPSATATPASSTICSGNASSVALSSNVAGTTYSWTVTQNSVSGASSSSGSSITQTLTATSTSAGTAVYTITPTASSCAGTAITATVTVNPIPSATATPNTQTICSGNASSLALTSNVAGTTYSWTVTQNNVSGASSGSGSSIAQTLTATGTTAGTAIYTITPTAGSCAGSAITATVTVNPIPSATATPNSQGICSGNASSISLSSNVAGTTYSWTVTQTNVSGAAAGSGSSITQTLTATTSSAGTVVYTITPTANSCAGSAITATVTVSPIPSATATPNSQTICSGGASSISLSSNVAGTTYSWTVTQTGVSGASAGSGSAITQTISTTGSTNGTAVYTITPGSGGCTGSAITATVTVHPIPSATATPSSQSICSGNATSVALSSNVAGTTYAWTVAQSGVSGAAAGSGSSITQTLTATGTSAGTATYTITPTAATCSGTDIVVTVTVNPIPSATATPNSQTFCSNNATSIALSSNVTGTTFSWTVTQSNVTGAAAGSGTTIAQTLTATTVNPGTATYTITPSVGTCNGSAITATVTVNPAPSATATPTSSAICSGNTTSIALASTTGGTTFAWTVTQNNVSGASAGSGSSIAQTLTATGTTAGTAVYTITPSAGGCAGTAVTATVTVNPIPSATATPASSSICSNNATSIGLSSNVAGTTYSWTVTQTGVSGASAASGSSITQTLTTTGTTAGSAVYTITPTASSCAGSAITATVTVNPIPSATATPNSQSICSGNASSINLTSNVAGTTFAWTVTQTNVSGASAGSGSSIAQTLSATGTTAGTAVYTITPTARACAGSAITATVTVNPIPAMTSASTATICSGGTVNIPLTSNVASTYTWIAANNPNTSGESITTQTTSTINNTITSSTGNTEVVVYTVTPTSTGGSCVGSSQTVSVTISPTPVVTVTPNPQTLCSGSVTSLSLTSNVTGTTFSWTVSQSGVSGASTGSGSSITQTLTTTGTTSGTAIYTITPSVGSCTGASSTATVVVNPVPSVTATPSSQTICSGNATSVALTSNVAGTTFAWTVSQSGVSGAAAGSGSSIAQTLSATGTTAGTATYTITPTAGSCPGSPIVVTVTVNPVPSATATPSSQAFCSGGATSIALTSDVAGTTFAWTAAQSGVSGASNSSGSTITQTLTTTGTSPGTVTYTITPTASGCAGTPIVATVTVNPIPAAPSASSNSPVCLTNTINFTAGNIAGATYSWSGPNSYTSNVQNPSIANAAFSDAGTYSVNVTVNGCTGPTATVAVVVNTPPPATLSPSSNSPVCTGQTLNLGVSGITNASYSWSGPNSFTSAVQNPAIPNVTLAAAGDYTINIVVPGCAASGSGTVNVVVNPTPVAPTAGNNGPLCAGSTLNLTASNTGTTYSWTGPAGFTDNNQNPSIAVTTTANAGVYSVTATALGCTSAAGTTTVVINPIPATPAPSSNSPICIGQTLNLSTAAVSGATYSWSGPNSFTASGQNPSVSNAGSADAGTYSLTVTVSGCTSSAGTVNVAVNSAPATPVAGSNSPVCTGDTLFLTSNTIPGATYSWTGPNSFTAVTQNPFITPVTAAAAGTYTVIANNGCASTPGTVSVTVNTKPAAPVAGSNSPICEGSTLNLTASNTGTTYSWAGPNSFTSSNQNPSVANVTAANAGVYSVTATANGCTSSTGTVNVVINPIPTPPTAGNNSPRCTGQTILLTASNVAGASYSWTGPNSYTSNVQNPSIGNATLAMAGDYSVTVTVSGCTSTAAVTSVTINPTPAAPTAGNDGPVCAGSTINLTASTVGSSTYSWTGPAGFTDNNQNTSIAVTTTASAGVYSVTATENGCTSAAGTTTVVINPIPATPVVSSNSPLCINATLNLGTSAVAGATYSWSGPNSFTASVQNPSVPNISTADAGTYSLSITVNGCTSGTGTVNVAVNSAPATPTASANNPVCAGDTLFLSASNIPGALYNWSGPNSFTSTAQNPSIAPVTLAASGTYTVVANNGCASTPATVSVTVNPSPAAPGASNNSPVCQGSAINFSSGAVAGATYNWSGPNSYTANTQNPTISSASATDAGTYSVTVTVAGCTSPSSTTTVTVNIPATDSAGPNQTVCANSALVVLTGTVSGGSSTGSWTTTGTGTFTPSSSALTATYTPSNADTAAGSVVLTLTSTNNGSCPAAVSSLTVTITDAPGANAGSNQSVCANNATINLHGSISGGATGGTWTTAGTGTFTPDANTLNATYTPSAADISNGVLTFTLATTGNGNCLGASSTMSVTITNAPTANAGPDQIICKGTPNTSLSGTVTVTNAGTWTTLGSGSFTPNDSALNATYVPSTADTSAGSVLIVLTSAHNGGCMAVSDTMKITYTDIPVVNAGPDQTICANATISLSGSVTVGSTTGIWTTSGTGTFTPNNTALNGTYIPSNADTAAGVVTFTLTSTNGCVNVNDSMSVTITDGPVVNAGADQTVCATAGGVTLNGSFGGAATGAMWSSTGSGTFNPDNVTMNATYVPSSADTTAGSVKIILTSTGMGSCSASTDTMKINFTKPPVVTTSGSGTICANNSAPLTGTVVGGSGTGVWSTPNGAGVFLPNSTTLNASYHAVNSDTLPASILLILTSTNNGGCTAASDTVLVTVTPGPIVNAGADQNICSNNTSVSLNASVLNATGGQWSTLGSGSFSPVNTALTATYTPSAADVTAGSVTLVLASSGNGSCQPATDTLKITFTPAPSVNAGTDYTVCNSSGSITLNGAVSGGASTGQWTTLGSGLFAPNDSALNASYSFSSADTTAGSVSLVLTSTNNGNCMAVSDTVKVTFNSSTNVTAGNDTTVCGNSGAVTLHGTVSGSSVSHWSSNGTGTFAPNDSTLNATYTPSAADVSAGSVEIKLTSGTNGQCAASVDSMMITFLPSPIVNAGPNIPVCGGSMTVNLNGSVSGNTTTGQWSTLGNGTFSPNDSTLNATYTLSTADTTAGSVKLVLTSTHNGGCPASTDTMLIVMNSSPVANAGNDTSICSSVASIQLHGVINGGSGVGQWTTSGTGTFTPNDSTLNAGYTFSAADATAGTITLTLSSTYNGNCTQSVDSIHVIITPAPVVNAGANIPVCGGSMNVQLNGTISGGTTAQWTTLGSGTFSPNDSTLNATYNLSTADTTAGSVTLILTSTHNGSCAASADTMMIVMNAAPLANAGNDTAICGNATGIQLNGTVTGGSGMGQWTTSGTGTFTPNDSTLSATYTFGAADITAGTITLTLSSINNGNCTQSVDSIHVMITAPPSVNAGTDISICNGTMSAQLNGTVSGGASDGMWSTLGSGTFSPNDSTLNATYNLSTADSTAGSVTLVLTTIHNGSCVAVSDTVKIFTNSIATVAAGNDTSICANAGSIQLNGSIAGGSPTGQWTTLGSGTFSPNDSTLNATYNPGASDLTSGSVILVLTSTHNCVNKSDSMTITFDSTAVANAGSNQTVCPSAVIALNGSISGASSGHWSTNGTGTFNPNDSTLNATYTPAGTDNDTLVFVLTASGNSLCGVAKDSITVIRNGQPNGVFYANNTCLGSATNFADSTQGATAWHWNFGNGDTSNVQNPSYTYTVNGTYTVTEIVSSGSGCRDTVQKTVTVNAAPTASFTFSANCLSDSVHFTDNSSVSPGAINSWSWSFGDGGASTVKNPQHQYDSIANYTVTLNVVSDSGCTAAATQTLSVNPSPLAGFTAQSNCSATVLFTDTSKIGTGTVTAWSWTFGDGGTSTAQNPSYTYNTPGTYTVLLQAQSNNGCKDTASKMVTIGSPVVAQYNPQGGSYNVNQGISFSNQSTGAVTYTWTFGDNTTSTATDPSHSFTNAGTYTVMLVATNSTGCSDTIQHEFTINSSGYTVPTGFTPNGDNLNDYFYIMGGPFSEYELRVFNEWGQQIFLSNSQADKWDGSFNGFIQPQGTYIYIFNGKLVDGKEVKLHNQINLVR